MPVHMNAERITIETDEDGFRLVVETPMTLDYHFRIDDPEALYDHVKAAIGPWLRERDEARSEWLFTNPVEASGAYDPSDPKHPDHHSIHADLWDNREGK